MSALAFAVDAPPGTLPNAKPAPSAEARLIGIDPLLFRTGLGVVAAAGATAAVLRARR